MKPFAQPQIDLRVVIEGIFHIELRADDRLTCRRLRWTQPVRIVKIQVIKTGAGIEQPGACPVLFVEISVQSPLADIPMPDIFQHMVSRARVAELAAADPVPLKTKTR